MPIYLGKSKLTGDNKFIRKIPLKLETDIKQNKRVYLKDQEDNDIVVWGDYDILYYYGKDLPEKVEISNEIDNYIWGLEYELPIESDSGSEKHKRKLKYNELSDAIKKYPHKWYGWYQGTSTNAYNWVLDDYIDKDYHWDLKLYSQWKQKKFTYSGTCEWKEQTGGGGGGDFQPRTAMNDSYWGNMMNTNRSDYWGGTNIQDCLPNCTQYAKGRCLEVGCTPYTSWGGSVAYDKTKVKVGDVVGDSTHVAFVERVDNQGTSNAVVYTSNSWYTTETGRAAGTDGTYRRDWSITSAKYPLNGWPQTLQGVCDWALNYWGNNNRIFIYSSNWSTASGHSQAEPTKLWINPSSPGGGSGGDEKVVTMDVPEKDCSDQQSPSAKAPKGKWSSGSPKKKTYIRTCVYSATGACSWPAWEIYKTSWDTSTWPDKEKPELDVDYWELDYIEADGRQGLNTKIYGGKDIKLEYEARYTKHVKKQQDMGSYDTERFWWGLDSDKSYNFIFAIKTKSNAINKDTEWHKYTISGDGNNYFDGKLYKSGVASITQSVPLFLFVRNSSSNYNYLQMKKCYVYSGSEKVREFVPAKRKTDNVCGMWDRITKKFYTSVRSTGETPIAEFIEGNIIGDLVK